MYSKIEREFKSQSWRKSDVKILKTTIVIYIILAILILLFVKENIYFYIILPALQMVLILYTYMYFKLKKTIHGLPFLEIKNMRSVYIKEKNKNDLELLIRILKENGINTRPKVQEAIRHYQTLIPRNIVGSGLFLSIIALTISLVTFVMSENNQISSERLGILIAFLFLIGILYVTVKMIDGQIRFFYSPEFYKYIEEELSIIYFKNMIK